MLYDPLRKCLVLTVCRSQKWLSYLLPPREEEDSLLVESGVLGVTSAASPQTASTLRHLLNETADLIESPTFGHVLTLLNNEGFATLIERKCANDAFKSSLAPDTSSQPLHSTTTIAERKTKLANVLAVLARQAHVIGNGANPPNEYLTAMDQGARELEAFAAVIYSSNFDLEVSGSEPKIKTESLMTDREEEDTTSLIPPMADAGSNVVGGTDPASEFEKAWGKAVEEDEKPMN